MTALLQVDGARVVFGGLAAVDGVDLTVDEGATVGLIGPNGAGKTTLFNAVSGHQPLTAGRVRIGGRDVTSLAPHQRAALGLGRSFQNLGLMQDETAVLNVLAAQHLQAGWRDRRRLVAAAEAALDAVGMLAVASTRVRDLSFAAARAVELACVLVSRPRLVLLDEPTTGLDPAEIETLRGVLTQARDDGATLLVIAHDVPFVMGLCEHVHVLAFGKVIAAGPPDAVRDDPAVIEAYLGAAA